MDKQPGCLVCKVDDQSVPLINIRFKNENYWICPQHLPILIHKPEQLVDVLPGIEAKPSPQHHHD